MADDQRLEFLLDQPTPTRGHGDLPGSLAAGEPIVLALHMGDTAGLAERQNLRREIMLHGLVVADDHPLDEIDVGRLQGSADGGMALLAQDEENDLRVHVRLPGVR